MLPPPIRHRGGFYIRPSMPAISAGPQVPAVRSGRIYNAPLRGRKTRTPAGIGSWSGRPYRPPLQRTGGGAVGADFISARASLRFPQAPRFRRCGRRWCRRRILGQHRTIWQEHSAKDFASYESYKRAGILYVFPPFITARMGQKIGRRPQTQLCGDALEKV